MTLTTQPQCNSLKSLTVPSLGPVAYREVGNPKLTPLVLLHGVGMQSAAWGPQLDAFSDKHHVFALDLPGHGGSDPLPKGAGLAEFVGWLHAVLSHLKLGPVNLAGHSMGALIAGGYAVTHPNMVARVALLNGVFLRTDAARAAVEARADEILDGQFDLETPLVRWFGPSAFEQKICAQVSGWLSSVDPGGYATAYGAFARGDALYADRFAGLTAPLLALTGADDPNSTPEMSAAMADRARNGQAVVINGHRHMVNLTAPDQVNSALDAWLLRPLEERQSDE
ncbi:alpha/beta fold hydrolase [Aliiroseovarius lamellibrachiae]|uniref:alpha/beta fold hydrolase n=1 Tax=Aliiroseovarius lamellibrachiae TaxID=1924933 RepID=UPI001BE01233|nr:alpha/beta hydrolase [Aliiroseovarius lamellibrachiae]MBT2131028.1 alpha/beta hydrolase [Aliiroseovarius lamellibrachiae]